MLVLSKLDWDVNFVIALDYLEPLSSLLSSTSSSDLPSASSDLPPAKAIQTVSLFYSALTILNAVVWMWHALA